MKKENQMGILRMVAKDFRKFDDYEVTIVGDSATNEFAMELKRNFINKVSVSYTADDIIRISNENDGNVFQAILNDFSKRNKELTRAKYKNI